MSDEKADRGVDIELLAAEIRGAGLDLETAALRYVRKLDVEHDKANQVDYVAIVERAKRAQENSGDN